MKFQVGDLVLLKHCEYKYRPRPHPLLRPVFLLRLHLHPRLRLQLFNSYGIVTQAIKHSDAWEGDSTNGDNVYVWFSQVDGREYCFYENEVTGEVVE